MRVKASVPPREPAWERTDPVMVNREAAVDLSESEAGWVE
jgi:hypothetical protein